MMPIRVRERQSSAVAILFTLAVVAGVWLGSRGTSQAIAAPPGPGQEVEARLAAAQVWLPAMGASRAGCVGRLVLQNLSSAGQRGVLLTWGDSRACPPDSAGPVHIACTGLIAPQTSWILQGSQLGAGSRSGTVYSFADLPANPPLVAGASAGEGVADLACEAPFAWIKGDPQEYRRFQKAFLSDGRYRNFIFDRMVGDPLAISWTERCGEDLSSYDALRWGESSVWSEPEQAQLSYLPLIGADWEILVQNMGPDSADAALRLDLGDGRWKVCEAPRIAPGEARTLRVADCAPEALSARVSASQPIAVVARRAAEGPRAAYAGRGVGGPELHLAWPGDRALAAVVGLQNPSTTLTATVRLQADDRWGNRRLLREARLGPGASLRLDLAASELGPVSDAAFLRVESVADDQGRRTPIVGAAWQQRDGLTIAAQELLVGTPEGTGTGLLALPIFQSDPAAPTRLVVHNDVGRFGRTVFSVAMYDRVVGLIGVVCMRLDARASKVIALDVWRFAPSGFSGSAVISASYWEHDRDDDGHKLPDNPVGLSATFQTGDASKGDPDLMVGLAMAPGSYRLTSSIGRCLNPGPLMPPDRPGRPPTLTPPAAPPQGRQVWLPALFNGP
ncbi:MAG: hypothetical protein IPJ58_00935 [Ardenticatenia bacterium]|nr:hypothetical protein [Ardenticatenia bacterium]